MQFAFTSADGAAFECIIGFGDFDYANLNFHDFGRSDVPLHLSFRLRRQVAVYNQFLGGAWGPERPAPVEMAAEGNRVRVEFYLNIATVLLNGRKIGTYDLPEPADGTDHAIHWVSFNGGADKVQLSGEAHDARKGRGILLHDKPFLLEGWGFDPGAEIQSLAVELVGSAETLPIALLDAPEHAREQRAPSDRIGVMAIVPGWIWQHVADEAEEAELQLTANGRPCGTALRLSREALLETIEQVCDGGASGNPLELLSALEHVRFGEMAGALSQNARKVLSEAATRYGVSAFYAPDAADEAPPVPALGLVKPRPDAADGQADADRRAEEEAPETLADVDDGGYALSPVEQAKKDISLRMAGVAPENMATMVRDFGFDGLTESECREFLLSMTGNFCRVERFDEVYEIARNLGLGDMPSGTDDWTLVLSLPYLYRQERGADIAASMRLLPGYHGWVDHSILRWLLSRAVLVRPPFLTMEDRDGIVTSILAYMESESADYFGVLHSDELIAIAATLVEALPTFAEFMQDTMVEKLVHLYGASSGFWVGLEAAMRDGRVADLPHKLRIAHDRFRKIRSALAQDDPASALAALPRVGADAARFRREMAAAAQARGLPVRDALDAALSGTAAGSDAADDAVLRHLAFPCDIPDLPDLADTSRRAIRRQTPYTARSLMPARQVSAGHHARSLLAAPMTDAAERAAMLDVFFADCALLASWRDEYLGHSLAISLLAGALTNGDAALVAEIPSRMADLLKPLDDGEIDSVCACAGVRNALWGLRQAPSASRSDHAAAVFEAFASAMPELPAPFEGARDALVPRTGIAAFHGILVVVYSCVPNLETRLPALRKTWLAELEAAGIPYVVAVGDGDGRREGDVVHLDAPDSYEALTKKSLAMAEWAISNTGFSHLYKIDDDCFLDVDTAIGGLTYRKYAYYGRRVLFNPGQTDRLWHHLRGARGMAAQEIDKSAEPSEFADGSTGYVLNRRAMQDLVDTPNTRHGAWLRLVSFMEDKLVGDMLALTGIAVENRDYNACILRRSHRGGIPISRWENGFLPSAASPAPVAHLESVQLQGLLAESRHRAALLPKRIWPGFAPAKLGGDNLQVELISPQEKLDVVNGADLCVVACVRNEIEMLPMFLAHYRALGVEGFLISDNCSDDGTLEYLAEQPDVAVFSSEANYRATHYGVAWQQAILSNLRMNRWSLIADADEFLVLPDGVTSLSQLLLMSEFEGADCARVFMLDLYPDGNLADATLASESPFDELTHCDREPFIFGWGAGTYYNSEAWTSAVRHRLMAGSRQFLFVAQKYPLIRYKPWMRFTAGLHFAAEVNVAQRDLMFAHFKYHAAFHERARIETERGQHFNNAEEYRKYLALMAEGRDRIFDAEVSVPWRECAWVKRVTSRPGSFEASAAAE